MTDLPILYFIAAILGAVLLFVAVAKRHEPWSMPFGVVVATVIAWYLIEPIYFPELFLQFKAEDVESAFGGVIIFLISLLFFAPQIAARFRPKLNGARLSHHRIAADNLVFAVMFIWAALLAFGTWRMDGDIVGALFPIGGRQGSRMWARAAGADAGAGGFLVSTASYIYVLCLASFGVLYFFARKSSTRALIIAIVLLSWPYSFLQGSRNIALATVAPTGVAFLLFARVSGVVKFFGIVVGFFALDFSMRAIIAFRNTGFYEIDFSGINSASHLGLNMASELVYIISFLDSGTVSISFGSRYLAEIANIVPRVIWPNKPLVGIEYAIARGFGDGGASDIGVFATISSGMIGQGVLNFGIILGPICAAFLMSCWIGFLARLRSQGTPTRVLLFLVGLGLTFNLGRDITLLVLWPMIFGYIGVRVVEYRETRRFKKTIIKVSRAGG